ncbi:MAG: hypothetical protein J7M03_01695 [Candidatus Desulfofervidaceae bacterium]|nr:hypothetical protein [Candidatus Desulfofervidaceae bacterium]MDL1970456.1 hypothetical protein [Candidatus Desulfofervidaceae bacterium]
MLLHIRPLAKHLTDWGEEDYALTMAGGRFTFFLLFPICVMIVVWEEG